MCEECHWFRLQMNGPFEKYTDVWLRELNPDLWVEMSSCPLQKAMRSLMKSCDDTSRLCSEIILRVDTMSKKAAERKAWVTVS
jgi:hypothetical protein